MPHYADGTEAKVGDQVVGKLYNTEGKRAGTIISITPGTEACNAQVQFTEALPAESPNRPRMSLTDNAGAPSNTRVVKGEQHGSAGGEFTLFTCVDYCATNELTKVGP